MADNIFQKTLARAAVRFAGEDAIEKSLMSGDKPGGAKGYIDVVAQDQTLGARTPTNYQTLYRIYKQEPWVRASVDAIRRTSTSKGWEIVPVKEDTVGDLNDNNKDTTAQQVLLDFFNMPNPDETMNDILDGITTDLQIYGNAYLEIVPGGDTMPKELWNLDATSMRVKYDIHGYIEGYVQRQGASIVNFNPDEVIHFRLNSKGSTQYGMSPIETIIATVDTDLKAQIYTRKYFENFGSPKGLFKMKNATPEQVRRNRLYLATQVAGIDNAHRNLMLEGDVEYQTLSSEFKDTESLKVRKFLRDEIIAVFGVPPSKISVIESGNIGGGTGKSQDKTFMEETIYPLQNKISAKINHQLIKTLFGIEDWKFQFVREDEEDMLQKAKVHDYYLRDGVLSVNEVRAELGYESIEGADDEATQDDPEGIISPDEDLTGPGPDSPTARVTETIAATPDPNKPSATAQAAKPQNAKEQVQSPSKRPASVGAAKKPKPKAKVKKDGKVAKAMRSRQS
jgi:HK97 family phage portal protein